MSKERRVVIRDVVDVVARIDSSADTLGWLAELLRAEGRDLMEATETQLRRGSPVYVEANADVVEVQRLMAQNHIRRLPVVQDTQLVGVVDLLDLAQNDAVEAAAHPSVAEIEGAVLPPLDDETDR